METPDPEMAAFIGLTPTLVEALRVVAEMDLVEDSLLTDTLETLIQLGYVERHPDRVALTAKVRRYLSSVKRRKTVWRPSG